MKNFPSQIGIKIEFYLLPYDVGSKLQMAEFGFALLRNQYDFKVFNEGNTPQSSTPNQMAEVSNVSQDLEICESSMETVASKNEKQTDDETEQISETVKDELAKISQVMVKIILHRNHYNCM